MIFLNQIFLSVVSLALPLTAFATVESNCNPVRSALELQQFIANDSLTADVLLDKIPAVHATNVAPSEGVLKSGAVRDSVHFSLGELVREHRSYIGRTDWGSRKMAVIAPLRSLMENLINLNTYDSFTIGEYVIPAEGILLVPRGEEANFHDAKHKIATYDPSSESLRQAVDRVIAEQGFWSIEMKEDFGGKSGIPTVHMAEAYIGAHNVNNLAFLKPIFEKFSYLTFGSHITAEIGEAHRLGIIEHFFQFLLFDIPVSSATSIAFRRKVIESHIEILRDFYKEAPPKIRSAVERSLDSFQSGFSIVDFEISARQQFGVSMTFQAIDRLRKFADNIALLKQRFLDDLNQHPGDYIRQEQFDYLHRKVSRDTAEMLLQTLPDRYQSKLRQEFSNTIE